MMAVNEANKDCTVGAMEQRVVANLDRRVLAEVVGLESG
jgi:hypothetical protein